MKKLRFIINTLSGGGAEKVLVDLLNQLCVLNYRISLVSVTGGIYEDRISDQIHYRKLLRFRNEKLNRLFSKIIYKMPRKLFSMMFLQGQYDYEVAYLEGFPTRVLAVKKTTATKLAFVHCDLKVNDCSLKLYKDRTKCYAEYQNFDKVCFVSKQSKKSFEEMVGVLVNACIIHNVLDVEGIKRLSEVPTDFRFITNGLKLITVGRLTKQKAFDRLIDVAAELEEKYSFELWIVGEGDERPNLERQIRALSVKSVRLLGYHKNPYHLMKQADLYICSSLSEGYSTAVTESLILGVPVVTTNCAGMDEILNNGTYGMIVENSEEGLYNGLLAVLSNPAELVGYKFAFEEKRKELLENKIIKEYLELFSD